MSRTQKKQLSVVVVLAALGCGPRPAEVVWSRAKVPAAHRPAVAELTCDHDADCSIVSVGCCGCSSMGSQRAIRTDRVAAYNEAWTASCADPDARICLQAESSDPVCLAHAACVAHECVLVK